MGWFRSIVQKFRIEVFFDGKDNRCADGLNKSKKKKENKISATGRLNCTISWYEDMRVAGPDGEERNEGFGIRLLVLKYK